MTHSAKLALRTGIVAATLGLLGCEGPARFAASTSAPTSAQPQFQTPPEEIIHIQLHGVLVHPGITIRIPEGERIVVHAAADQRGWDFTHGGRSEGIPVLARHDAPSDQVMAGGIVRVRGSDDPGVVHIRAVEDDVEEPDTAFSLWLELDEGYYLGEGRAIHVDRTPLRFLVVDAAPVSCGDTRIQARSRGAARDAGEFAANIFGDEVQKYQGVDLTLDVADPNLHVSLAASYRTFYEHLDDESVADRYNPFPMGFVLDSRLQAVGDDLRHSLSLAHFGPLRLLAESPACGTVEVACEDGLCDVQ